MSDLEVMTRCGHCGSIANSKLRASYSYDILVEASDGYEQRIWLLLQCSVCSRPILAEITNFEKESIEDLSKLPYFGVTFMNGSPKYPASPNLFEEYSMDNRILYPLEKNLSFMFMLPSRVHRAYISALKVKNVEPGAFAVMVGKTLEVVCSQENAKGKVLADKLKNLADSGRIPQVLAEMAKQLRLLRNLAAHASEDDYEIKEEDVPIIHEFVDAILEYLYIAPTKISLLQDRIDGKYKSTTSSDHPF